MVVDLRKLLERRPTAGDASTYCVDSGTMGLGGIFDDRWFSARCPRRFRDRDIQFKEIYAVLQAILRRGHLWKHCHVIFNVDNAAVVSALSSGTNRNVRVMNVLRMVVMLAAQLEFSFSSFWPASAENALADTMYRFTYARLFTMAPPLRRKPCSPHPQLRGIKYMLTSRPAWPSSCGTAWPPKNKTARSSFCKTRKRCLRLR